MRKIVVVFTTVLLFLVTCSAYAKEVPFTLEDRDRLIKLETTLKELKESIDKRFEQVDKRFEQMFTFLWILTGIFTAIMVGNIGFAYWDRRTIIKKAKAETIAEIEKEGRVRDMIGTLRELAKTNTELARVLRHFNLL